MGCRDEGLCRESEAEDVETGMSASEGSREAGQQLEVTVGFRRVVLLKPKNTQAMFYTEQNDQIQGLTGGRQNL